MIQSFTYSLSPPSIQETKQFLLKWTPRTIAMGFGAYYGLGFAYERGWMAAIDRLAIQILKKSVGYAGIGALMPTVQWYASHSVRIVMGMTAALSYDLTFHTICMFILIPLERRPRKSN